MSFMAASCASMEGSIAFWIRANSPGDLIAPHLKPLLRIVQTTIGSHPDVEDIVQQTALKAITHLGQFRFEASFRTWLIRIGLNEARQWRRKCASSRFLALDLPTGRFDIVVSVDVIPYVDNQRAFLHKVAMVLKSRGYFIIICPNKFVWDRTRFTRQLEGKVPVRWLHMRDLKDLLSRHFVALHSETIIPGGNLGILRLINSNKVERAIETIIRPDRMVKLKEWVGLGKSLVVLAQKRE